MGKRAPRTEAQRGADLRYEAGRAGKPRTVIRFNPKAKARWQRYCSQTGVSLEQLLTAAADDFIRRHPGGRSLVDSPRGK